MKYKYIIYLFLISIFFTSCKKNTTEVVIAKVNDHYLYKSDIESLNLSELSIEDSTQIVNQYINSWVESKLILDEASKVLSDSLDNFEKQIEEYRNSLIIYSYEKQLIAENLITSVNEEEITKYYNDHLADFLLKENIVKVRYIKLYKDAKQISDVKKWIKSDNADDIEKLNKYALTNSDNIFLNDDAWLLLNQLIKEIPLKAYNQEELLQNNKLLEITDTNYRYIVYIVDYKITETSSPLSLEKENIKNIILTLRKKELIDNYKKQLFEDASENNKFKIY